MFSRFRLISISALIFIMAGASYGQFQVDQTVPYSNLTVPGTLTLDFDKFDPNLGTLLQVVLTLDVNPLEAGSIAYDNEDPHSGNAELSIQGEIEADTMMTTAPLSAVFTTPVDMASAILLPDNDAAPDFLGADALAVTGTPVSGSDQASASDPPTDLSEYIGPAGNPGTFDMSLRTTAMFTITVEGALGALDITPGSSDGEVTVTYIYIPEPASLAMVGFGGLLLLRRRRPRIG